MAVYQKQDYQVRLESSVTKGLFSLGYYFDLDAY